MKVTVVAVGKIREPWLREGIAEYERRLGRYVRLDIREVADIPCPEGASEAQRDAVRDKEATALLRKLPDNAWPVVLDVGGRSRSSEAWAEDIRRHGVEGRSHLALIIGGSQGLGRAVRDRAREALSFSAMTFPHQLMRLILLEQLYRACRINAGEPYHK